MILDTALFFSDEQSVSATAVSTKAVDCGQELLTTGLNGGNNLVVLVNTLSAFVGTSATIAVELQECDTSSGTFAVVASSPAIAAADFDQVVIPMPLAHKRYLKLNYKVTGTISTAGKVSAYIANNFDAQQTYEREDSTFQ